MKASLKNVLRCLTYFSFFLLFSFAVIFTFWAPGHYSWDTEKTLQSIIMDVIFFFILLFNVICVLASLLTALWTCRCVFVNKEANIKTLTNVILDLCPLLFLLAVAGGKIAFVETYLKSPFYILKKILFH